MVKNCLHILVSKFAVVTVVRCVIKGMYILQIIMCSRTHSQLSQFIGEIERSPYNNFRVIPLASRQSYCINTAVHKLKSLTLMNER